MKPPHLFILSLPVLLLLCLFLYWSSLIIFFGYELSSNTGAVDRLIQKAIDEKNPSICNHLIHFEFLMGTARYEHINGCKYEYATATGDISVCMDTMGPDSCVQRIAQERNEPELCAQAVDPRRQGTDGRGTCFGYFAKREREIEYCRRLVRDDIPRAQKRICLSYFIDACPETENPDECLSEAAILREDVTACERIKNQETKEYCKNAIEENL